MKNANLSKRKYQLRWTICVLAGFMGCSGCALWADLNTPDYCRPGSGPNCVCSVPKNGQDFALSPSGELLQPDRQGRFTIANFDSAFNGPLPNGDTGGGSCVYGYWLQQDCGAPGQLPLDRARKCGVAIEQARDKAIQETNDTLMAILAARSAAAPPAAELPTWSHPLYTNCTSVGPSTDCTTSQW